MPIVAANGEYTIAALCGRKRQRSYISVSTNLLNSGVLYTGLLGPQINSIVQTDSKGPACVAVREDRTIEVVPEVGCIKNCIPYQLVFAKSLVDDGHI